MATLSIISNFHLLSSGIPHVGKQGATTGGFLEPLGITVTGTMHAVSGSLGDASAVTVYDDDNDVPADWDYAYLWADTDLYVQIIGATGNAVLQVEATVPLWLPGFDTILVAANTTALDGSSTPSMEDIDSIVLVNRSGGTAAYYFALID